MQATAPAWGLYLVLVTVGDEHGLSYYADRTLARLLSLSEPGLLEARRQLLAANVIAYEAPLYQVLALDRLDPGNANSAPSGAPANSANPANSAPRNSAAPQALRP